MTKPIIQIGDVSREMTDAEYAEWQALCADLETQAQAAADAAAAKKSARDKLKALGLTDDEIAALVG